MERTIQLVIHPGYVALFVRVFLEQGGLPIPKIPVLPAAGTVVGTGS